jgi:flagellar assembly protein FliH
VSSPDRIFAGRRARLPGDRWTGAAALHGGPALSGVDPATRALVEARDRAEAGRLAEAMREADARGYEAGHARAEAELASAVAAAGVFGRALETAVPRDVDMVARTVAELAIVIARKIIGAELRHDPSVLIAAIEAGLRQAVGASSVQAELHPDAVAPVEAAWLARHGQRHRGMAWSFVADPTLPPGGCRLRTEFGVVEAGLEDQLTEVAAALDAAIPAYVTSALGVADAVPAGRAADLATLASSPAGPVHPASRLDPTIEALYDLEPELPISPADDPVAESFGPPDFGVPA